MCEEMLMYYIGVVKYLFNGLNSSVLISLELVTILTLFCLFYYLDFSKSVSARQKLETQVTENKIVKEVTRSSVIISDILRQV